MKKVLINTNFKDIYTENIYVAGEYAEMTEERIAEIKAVDPNFVTVVGNVEKATKPAENKPKAAAKGGKGKKKPAEAETPSADDLIDELDDAPEDGTTEDITE